LQNSPATPPARRFSHRVVVAFTASACFVVALFLWWGTARQTRRATAWVKHTTEVELAIAVAHRRLDAIATSATSATAASAADAERAEAELVGAIADVARLTSDNPRQQERTSWLTAHVAGARKAPASLAAMRSVLDAMHADEEALMEERADAERRAEVHSSVITVVASALGVLLLATALLVERRSTRTLSETTQQLRASEERLRHMAENITDLIWIHDTNATRKYVSPSCERLLGWSPHELLVDREPVLHADDWPAMRAAIDRLVREPDTRIDLLHRLRCKDGTYRWFETALRASVDESGCTRALHSIGRDVTERLRIQEQLHAAKDAAEAAARSKTDFLARMSHEIRTPMNGVLGMTELALQTQLTSEQREFIATARSSAESLLAIIDDILDFSKIEAGKLRLDASRFALRSTLGRALRALTSRANEKRVPVLLRVDDDVPDSVVGDPHRLMQVVVNLVGNAVKFTDKGEVVVRVRAAAVTTERASLTFSVRDTGIGIAPDKLGVIFEAFTQAEESTTRTFGGTGLGLAICRQLVTMMNGCLSVESELGQGSVFTFAIDVADPVHRGGDGPVATAARGARVVLVKANETGRKIIEDLLTSWGTSCDAFGSVADAADRVAARRVDGAPFDLAIVDGSVDHGAAASLARIAGPNGVPLVMLGTPPRDMHDVRTAWIPKPVVASDLLETIEALLTGVGRSSPLPLKLVARTPRRLLVAEDNVVNRRVATAILERVGHTVVAVGNGRQAISALSHDAFDLVLMDVQMPEMDGLEATRRIRKAEAFRGGHVPIVALTAQAMKGDADACLAAGMDAYLSKPLSAVQVLATIDELTSRAHSSVPTFDRDALVSMLEDDALVAEAIALYRAEAPALLERVVVAAAANDADGLVRAAHELKGTLLSLQCAPASSVAAEIELAARGGDVPIARAHVPALCDALAEVDRALAA